MPGRARSPTRRSLRATLIPLGLLLLAACAREPASTNPPPVAVDARPPPSAPVAPSGVASVAAPVASPVVPREWHWVNPRPQGETLNAVAASAGCGVLALGREGALVRSTDDGVTWSDRHWKDRWDIEFATLDGETLYAIGVRRGTSALLSSGACGSGEPKVLKTFDRATDGACNDLAVDRAGHLYVTTVLHQRGRVLCSADRGATLRVCDERATPLYALFVSPTGTVWVAGGNRGTEGGVVRESLDQGATWRTIGSQLGTLVYGVWGDTEGKRLVATGASEVITSVTSGATWTPSTSICAGGGSMMLGPNDAPWVHNDFWKGVTGNPATGTYITLGGCAQRGTGFSPEARMITSCPSCGGAFRAATVTSAGTWISAGWEGAIARSVDDGATWEASAPNPLNQGHGIVAVRSDAGHLFVLLGNGMVRSDDGGQTFVPLATLAAEELRTTEVSTADLASFAVDGPVVLVPRPGHGAVARSGDRGAAFAEVSLPLVAGQVVTHVWPGGAAGDGVFYASGSHGALLRSRDRGAHWGTVSLGAEDDLRGGWSDGRDVYVVSAVSRVFHSGDGGEHWKPTPFERELLAVAASREDEVFVMGRDGDVFRSVDRGETWVPGARLGVDVRGFVVENGRLYVSANEDDHLRTSTDHGATFAIEPSPMRGGLLFPDGKDGVYIARENGFSGLAHLP